MFRSYRTMALMPAFLLRDVASFSPQLSSGVSTYHRSINSSAHVRLRLSPEEIAGSLGPDRIIASEPFSWNELKEIVKHGDPTMHSRSMEVQEGYILHSRRVKDEWKSMNDYILHSKFGFEKKMHRDGKFVSSPSLEQAKLEGRIETRLLLNEYPYYVCPRIEHWCLWKLGGKVESYELEWAEKELVDMEAGNIDEIMSWVNPPHLQSIPDIDHAHLLCLRSDEIDND
mmetsp:Transcript_27834/g.61290  ORF Transcript_27834/g.61290 Transcript_27834/m.61290 type:complete len:228 (+) Transcript_27834:126-809(+)